MRLRGTATDDVLARIQELEAAMCDRDQRIVKVLTAPTRQPNEVVRKAVDVRLQRRE